MVALGNFLFHYRNFLFPLFYAAVFIPSTSVFDSYTVAALLGLAVSLAGQGIRVLTIGLVYIIRGGSNRRIYAKDLVTTGIFSHCRNPLYIGNILMLLGVGIISNSLLFLVVFIPLFMFFYQAIVRAEENFLLGKFGDAYHAYQHDVNRWLPRFAGLGETLSSMRFHWKRVIIREYNATFIWMAGALIVFMRNVHAADVVRFNELLPAAVILLAVLAVLYLVVRYLKKSKKLRDE